MPMKGNPHSMQQRNDKKIHPSQPWGEQHCKYHRKQHDTKKTLGDHPWVGGTILGMEEDHLWQLSPGVSFVSKVQMPNSKNVLHFLLVGDHPLGGGWPSLGWRVTLRGMVGDHPWQLSPGVSFDSKVNAKFQVCSTLPSGGWPSKG